MNTHKSVFMSLYGPPQDFLEKPALFAPVHPPWFGWFFWGTWLFMAMEHGCSRVWAQRPSHTSPVPATSPSAAPRPLHRFIQVHVSVPLAHVHHTPGCSSVHEETFCLSLACRKQSVSSYLCPHTFVG